MKETKDVIVGTTLAGTVISPRMVIAVDNRTVKANNPTLMKQCDGSLKLNVNWARKVLNSMGWVNKKWTIRKLEPSEKFLKEEKLSFQ